MSKSLKRVRAALETHGIAVEIKEMAESTRTAKEAAAAAGCALDQIVKSIMFRGENSGDLILFLTAGGNQVCAEKATALAGEPLGKADARLIRDLSGFAIGGVSPVGHLTPIRTFCDPRLNDFDLVWAAAGTPRHIFAAPPEDVIRASGAKLACFTV
ncbi:YbaK/EbsC family protein [Aliiroseovarius crassostreae]|uniref:YbaK/EbsC family protein n=1 Tax=Aliiroseovarius crassostreae TaxID=154981 RepID=UPI002208F954|nr:YbaK/EbsC family protein [Aliiroseovarius crassostreae]UWP99934.1 YbaK/EbsC family protein [Aliiroseovarius crassostreae]